MAAGGTLSRRTAVLWAIGALVLSGAAVAGVALLLEHGASLPAVAVVVIAVCAAAGVWLGRREHGRQGER
jgi:hypothetical protein